MKTLVQWEPTFPTPWWVKAAYSMFALWPGLLSHAFRTDVPVE
jgi:hypothetical protein